MEEKVVRCRSVLRPDIARWLIRDGFRVVDIRPLKEDSSRTKFYFEATPEFLERLKRYGDTTEISAVEASALGIELGVIDD